MINPIGDNIKDFKLLAKIGSGGFAEVFKAECLRPGYEKCLVAIKRISKDYIFKKKCQQRIKNEIDIHKELSHPSIVKFHTKFEDKDYWYLVLELCGGGSFEEFVKHKQYLSEKEACPLIKQVIDGVQYLKLNQIIHRDLSLRNILLTEDGNAKIADFGLAVKCRPNEKKTSVLGTANFMSPEVVKREPYGFKVDFWSVGCILYALLYGAPPFDDKKKNSIMNGAVKSELRFPHYASNEAIELLKDMLEKDPRDRIEIKNALQYSFFRKYEKGSKYESNSQRSGDSGMNSLSSSRSGSSKSSRKMKETFYRERRNNYAEKGYNEKYSYELSNSQGTPRSGIQDDSNFGQQRAKSPCKPKLKMSAPGSWHRQKWEMANKQNTERRTCSYDNPHESQFEIPIKCCPDIPLYPPYLQNLIEENVGINSYNSCYDEIDSNKKYESIVNQRNLITRTNSQDNIQKYSCSHDQYCLPERNCLHKSSCYCHQCPVLVNRNSNSDHHSCEKEKKQEIKSSMTDKGLCNVLTPLTTVRLQPKRRRTTEKEIISILNDGEVCVEFLKLERKKSYVACVCFISHDGLKITIFNPKKKILPSENPPSRPSPSTKGVRNYSFENLPEKHWKKYRHAKLFVDIIRAKTPKVTIYGKDAKCVMMENAPCPDYQMNFYDGHQITEIGGKIIVMDQNGIQLTDEKKLDAHVEFLMNTFKSMKENCCTLEACLENLSKACDSLGSTYFPVIVGRRPSSLLRNLDDSKENASPRSMQSSTLNGTIAMKSYSGTINTDCSPYTNSSPASIPSPLSNRKSVTTEKNITDIVPALKHRPWVVNGWVIADYKDGIQMWIPMNDDDVFFLDNTKQRLSSNEHPELMKRFQEDLPNILRYALSEEVKKTK